MKGTFLFSTRRTKTTRKWHSKQFIQMSPRDFNTISFSVVQQHAVTLMIIFLRELSVYEMSEKHHVMLFFSLLENYYFKRYKRLFLRKLIRFGSYRKQNTHKNHQMIQIFPPSSNVKIIVENKYLGHGYAEDYPFIPVGV